MSLPVKRAKGVLTPNGTGSGVALGVIVGPLAVLGLAALLPGGFFFWAMMMVMLGIFAY